MPTFCFFLPSENSFIRQYAVQQPNITPTPSPKPTDPYSGKISAVEVGAAVDEGCAEGIVEDIDKGIAVGCDDG